MNGWEQIMPLTCVPSLYFLKRTLKIISMPQNELIRRPQNLPSKTSGQLLTQQSVTIGDWAVTKDEKQLAVTFSELKIAQYTNREMGDLAALIGKWWKLEGCSRALKDEKDSNGNPRPSNDLIILCQWIKLNFEQLTYTDIELAMTWSINRVLDIQHRPYVELSGSYISLVLKMYLERKQELVQEILERKRHKEAQVAEKEKATPQQRMQAVRDQVITAYNALIQHDFFYDVSDMVYNWLRKTTGQLTINKEEEEQAVAYAKEQIKKSKGNEAANNIYATLTGAGNETEKMGIKRFGREYLMTKYFERTKLGDILKHLDIEHFQ